MCTWSGSVSYQVSPVKGKIKIPEQIKYKQAVPLLLYCMPRKMFAGLYTLDAGKFIYIYFNSFEAASLLYPLEKVPPGQK